MSDPRLEFDEEKPDARLEFDEQAPAPATANPRTNAGEAAGLGALNSATLGFNDEIGGGVNALMQWAGIVPEIPRSAGRGDMTTANTSGYDAERNRQRELDASAQAEHGTAYGAGQLATGVALSGGLAGGAVKAGGRMLAEGAAQGVGDSLSEDASGMAVDAGLGAGTSVAAAGVMKGAGFVGKKIGQTAPAKLVKAKLQRLIAAGINPKNKVQMGAHTVDQQADAQSRMGVGKAKWGILPASTEEINEQAAEAVERTDAARDAIASSIKDTPVQAGQVGSKLRHQIKAEQGPIGRRADTLDMPRTPPQPQATPAPAPAQAATVPGGATAPGRLKKRQYHYHATPEANLPAIKANGLDPAQGGKNYDLAKNRGRIYFAPEDQADHWAKNLEDVSGQPSARLRTPRSVMPIEGANPNIKMRDSAVPPHDLEVRGPSGNWSPLAPPPPKPRVQDPALADTVLAPSAPPGPILPPRSNRVRDPQYEPIRQAKLEEAGYFDAIGDQPFSVMNELRKGRLGKAKYGSDTPQAAVRQDVHGAINDVMESAAGPQGAQWRALGQDEAMALRARNASTDLLTNEAKKGLSRGEIGAAILGAGAGASSNEEGLAGGGTGGVMAFAAARAMRGRGASTRAAASEVSASVRNGLGAIGRALDKTAIPVGGAVGRSIAKVQEAETPEEAAKAHFLESSTNPEYRKYAHDTE